MEYYKPIDETDPDASYSNGNLGTGVPGSIPDARAIEHTMREIVAVIVAAGLTPAEGDLEQLLEAIQIIADQAGTMDANSILSNPTNAAAAGQELVVTANKFLARGSSGNLGLKDITDAALAWLASAATTPRERLGSNRTYYVRTDGNDTNSGLVNNAGGAWLTIQKAITHISSNVDLAGYTATIQVADGTYTTPVAVNYGFSGNGSVILQGNTTTPGNCIISTTNADCIYVSGKTTIINIQGFKFTTTTSGSAISVVVGGEVNIVGAVEFGACATDHMLTQSGSFISLGHNYAISGGTQSHIVALAGASIYTTSGLTVTLTGTPAFSQAFAYASSCSVLTQNGVIFSGAATGTRYSVTTNAVITTAGGGANFFPGNAAGSTATGAQYT